MFAFQYIKKKNTDSVWQKPTQYYGAIILQLNKNKVFPGGSDDNESACNEGDLASIPQLGRSPGEGNSNVLQYPCLENPMDRGA